jgi:Leucine-rich repeat (LRR) protein
MDIINIFTILLLIKVKQNNKILMLSNYCKNIDTKYLWKLLLIRDNRINNLIRSYYNSYILYNKLNNSILMKIFNDIYELYKSTIFSISHNQLKNIPNEIGYCINLRTLYIYYNQLKNIPSEIGNCINLQYFYIYNNQLQNIPSEIGHCINLRALRIDNDQAKIISHKIKKQKYVKISVGKIMIG